MAILTPSNLKSIRFELTGLDEYLKKVQATGNSIDDAVSKAVEESAKPIHEDIKAWAKKHKLTGATFEGVVMTDVQREGNRHYVEVGIDGMKNDKAWHAVFVEYGTPKQAADPGIRPAFDKSRIKRIQKQVLQKEGIPVE